MLDILWRLLLGFVLLYALFVCFWLYVRRECLVYAYSQRDKKWTRGPDAPAPAPNVKPRSVNVVFIRHGESCWNETFNTSKNPLVFFPRLVKAAVWELGLMFSGENDSWFKDSPLSPKGFGQASSLRDHIAKSTTTNPAFARLMLGDEPSVVVCSPLRRAVSTCVVALWDRLQKPGQKVKLLSDLQEISPNPDTLSLTPAYATPKASWQDRAFKTLNLEASFDNLLDASEHHGSKSPDVNGQKRLHSFANWLFAQERSTVIVVGHSLFFQSFFKEFLPTASLHVAKQKKMDNAAAVSFTLITYSTPLRGEVFSIVESSITAEYLGFKK